MIIIRCNAGAKVGFGHLVRCRVLAIELKKRNIETIIIGPAEHLKTKLDVEIFSHWIARPEWGTAQEEANFHIEIARKFNCKYIILDDYRSEFEHQLLLRQENLVMLQQYDASKPQKFAAHFVINSSPFEKREFYEDSLYSDDIKMLHGPKYAILRSDFTNIERSKAKDNKILLTFGGGDDRGAVLQSLKALYDIIPQNYQVEVIVGEHNPRIDSIKIWMEKNNPDQQISLKINPPNISEIFAYCKFAIMGGGTSTFEAAYMGTPMILIPIASNQFDQGLGWQNIGAAIYLGDYNKVNNMALRSSFLSLIDNPNKLEKMADKARKSMDSLGTKRILDVLLSN